MVAYAPTSKLLSATHLHPYVELDHRGKWRGQYDLAEGFLQQHVGHYDFTVFCFRHMRTFSSVFNSGILPVVIALDTCLAMCRTSLPKCIHAVHHSILDVLHDWKHHIAKRPLRTTTKI